MTSRRTRHISVAKEIDAIVFETEQQAFNLACDLLEDNGFSDAAAALSDAVFDDAARIAVEGEGIA